MECVLHSLLTTGNVSIGIDSFGAQLTQGEAEAACDRETRVSNGATSGPSSETP